MRPEHNETQPVGRRPLSRALLVPALVLGGGYVLWSLVFAESSQGLLWLLLLACPLMHFLMPHGHGHGARDDGQSRIGHSGSSGDTSPPPQDGE